MPQAFRLPRLLLALCCLAVAPAARAELVVLQGGEVIKVRAYDIGPAEARLTLPSGGVLTLSVLRVDRVLADEILPAPEPPAAEDAPALVLGYREDDTAPATPFGEQILVAARRHKVSPALVAAVMRVESAFDARAVSRKGARGLMQLMPSTAARFGLTGDEILSPERNLDAGARYLRWLVDRFGNDPARVLAAYNAGEQTVERYGGVPPYRETRDYVRRVLSALGASAMALTASTR